MIESVRNLGDLIDRGALQSSDRTAIIDYFDLRKPRELSARQLVRLIDGVGSGLLQRGLRAGDRIAIASRNHASFAATFLGAMRVGMVPVPINFKLPPATIAHVLRDSAARLIFADTAGAELCRAALTAAGGNLDHVPVIGFDDVNSFDAFLRPGEPAAFEPGDTHPAYILYTSGSTGVPKGVVLAHSGQLWALRTLCQGFATLDQFRAIAAAPLYHMNALIPVLLSLASGASIVLMPSFDARTYLEAVAAHRANVLTSVPTMIVRMLRETDLTAGLDLSCVRMVMMGSAPTTEALLEQTRKAFPGAMVTNAYGTTEAGPAIFGPHPCGLPRPVLSIGYPLPDVQIRLVDGDGPDHGVLHVRTPALMLGYNNLPEQTRSKLRDGWYDTGDVVRRDADGFMFFVGRSDDMFVCGGENIYPGELEKVLAAHPLVAQSCVVPANDVERGQVPIAFVVPHAGADQASLPEALKQHALAHVPPYMYPRQIHLRDELPLAGTHKIDRQALVEIAQGAWDRRARLQVPGREDDSGGISMSESFSSSYAEARAKFVEMTRGATRVEALRNPNGTGPQGEPLYMDVAWFGRPDASRLFMTVSGTHGQEGFAGSGAQIGFLRSSGAASLPHDVAMLFVHASNPWGWANLSRTTEHNVDLNRNFVDHSQRREPHSLHAELRQLVSFDDMSHERLDAIWPQMMAMMQRYGVQEAVDAMAAGQYNDPQGTNYGGKAPEWSNTTLRDVVRRYCTKVRRVGFIDWHTGIGDFGESFFMCFEHAGEPGYERAARWYGADTLKRGQGGPESGLPWPKYTGLLLQGVQAELAALGAEMTGVVIEFGTYPLPQMFSALLVDQWLKRRPAAPDAAEWRTWMMERFCPADPAWRNRIVRDTQETYRRGIAGLQVW